MSAEHLRQPPPPDDDYGPDSGFNAMGKPVPYYRQQAAYAWLRSIGLSEQHAYECTAAVAEQLARDQPYEARHAAMRYIDLTGSYVLFALLLCAPDPAAAATPGGPG